VTLFMLLSLFAPPPETLPPPDTKELSFAYTVSHVDRIAKTPPEPDVYTVSDGKQSFQLCFDTKSPKTPKIIKWLEKGVKGKVRVKHRPGFIQFGEVKFLLVLDVEPVKEKK